MGQEDPVSLTFIIHCEIIDPLSVVKNGRCTLPRGGGSTAYLYAVQLQVKDHSKGNYGTKY